MPKETGMDKCINILLDEIQQAIAWSRPSILIAVHQSKNDQTRAITAFVPKLRNTLERHADISCDNESSNIMSRMLQEENPAGTVFLFRDLGDHAQAYDGLNLFREVFVERQLKVIFWLTREELSLLAHRAPDFWAFRHRVVEFPAGRSSGKNNLPSGVLLWHVDNPILDKDTIRAKITFYETMLQSASNQDETVVDYMRALVNLSHYHWLLGESPAVDALVNQELKQFNLDELRDVYSMLLNARAIHCFDQSDFLNALKWIEKALEVHPEDGILWSNHGVICRTAAQARKSLPSLKRGIKFNPASAQSYGVLGYVNMSLGKYSSAITNFEEALSLQPENIHFWMAVAICHQRLGSIEKLDGVFKQISIVFMESEYLLACREGLQGNTTNALVRLKDWVVREKIPPVLLRRDPILSFIFGNISLRELL